MMARWQAVDNRIAAFDTEFAAEVKQNRGRAPADKHSPASALSMQLLSSLPSVMLGPFARGRDLAAWLGLVPSAGDDRG